MKPPKMFSLLRTFGGRRMTKLVCTYETLQALPARLHAYAFLCTFGELLGCCNKISGTKARRHTV